MAEANYLLNQRPPEEKFDTDPKVGEVWTYDTGGLFRGTILLTKRLWWWRWEGQVGGKKVKIGGGDLRQRLAKVTKE